MDASKAKKIVKMIAEDMRNDATDFEGRSFNGKNVAKYFGHQGAAIAALAIILESMLEEFKGEE